MRLLFVTWDGPQVNYLESLFLPIFTGLRDRGIETDVLQFRWGPKEATRRVGELCREAGVGYRAAAVWRRAGGLGPMASALWGGRAVRRAVRDLKSTAVMPRSLMPAIAVLAAGGETGLPIVFDADGLVADERVEFAGLSATGATYRILRDVEAQAVRRSVSVIVRSEAAKVILAHRAGPSVEAERFHVVTNGRDEKVFSPGGTVERQSVRDELGFPREAPVLVYAGSVGPQYRFDPMGALVRALRAIRGDARLLVLSGDPDGATALLGPHLPDHATFARILRVPPEQVARYIAVADAGMAYRAASFAMRAVAPVKLAEYLLCGVPVVGTAAVGDTRAAANAGVFLDESAGAEGAARWIADYVIGDRERTRARAREVGVANFSLSRSVDDYARALSALC